MHRLKVCRARSIREGKEPSAGLLRAHAIDPPSPQHLPLHTVTNLYDLTLNIDYVEEERASACVFGFGHSLPFHVATEEHHRTPFSFLTHRRDKHARTQNTRLARVVLDHHITEHWPNAAPWQNRRHRRHP